MRTGIKLTKSAQHLLRCPICKSKMELTDYEFKCMNVRCKAHFPIIEGIPILVNETSSIFSIEDFINRKTTFFRSSSKIKGFVGGLLPAIDCNVKAKTNYEKFAELLLKGNENPKVLVVGGSMVGRGMQVILSSPSIEFIESDVSFGPRTALICD
ncbi:unnamed protein product, partial [marine sediment metagenome]